MAARRALLSVSDKRGVADFARALVELDFEVVSTGGTYRVIRDAGIEATYVTEVTGHPEVFDGRVKTLHPKVHGGILFRRDDPAHVEEAGEYGITPVDLVAVNLYPFEQTIAAPEVALAEAVEQIDIGGPAMVRAAAKNFAAVTVIVSPDDYDAVVGELREIGATTPETRRRLALAAFRHTARYDAAISRFLGNDDAEAVPAEIHEPLTRRAILRYGENPHQVAGLYARAGAPDLAGAQVLQGKALSYNNLVDLDGAVAAVIEFEEPAAVVVKHTNPCGVGRDPRSALVAYQRALAGDPVSAFGGIVAMNRTVDAELAETLTETFLEIVASTGFSDDARQVLARKKNLRVVVFDPARLHKPRTLRDTLFGVLAQTVDPRIDDADEGWDVVTTRTPTDDEATALRFLWRVCKHVKSNAIVVGGADSTLGVGAGQMSRVDAVGLAIRKATAPTDGASLASDAFFPFRDGVDAASAAGIRAVIQPGGSRRDSEVIAACNEHGIAMVFTGHRHFRH